MMEPQQRLSIRNAFFILVTLGAIAAAYVPLRGLLRTSPYAPYYAHIPLIPLVSAFFLVSERKKLFGKDQQGSLQGVFLMVAGISLFVLALLQPFRVDVDAAIRVLASLLFWAGGFWLLFGTRTLKSAVFPMTFLIFAVPAPAWLIERILSWLVAGTAAVAHVVFHACGIPFTQAGPVFSLPGMDFEVYPSCGGFRPGLALLITGLVAGHLVLTKFWRKVLLVVWVFPIAVIKSGVRFVTLYLLAYHVDMGVVEPSHFVHQFSGYVFFLIGLGILGLVLWLLRKGDNPPSASRSNAP